MDTIRKPGWKQGSLCLFSFLKEKIIPVQNDGNFESWVTKRFGKELCIIFFKSHSGKLWGIPCKELDEDFAAQRIKKLSLFSALIQSLVPSIKSKHKTLTDVFAYPKKGTGMVYEKMAESFQKLGGNLLLSHSIASVEPNGNEGVKIKTIAGEVFNFEYAVSTMPLNIL
ncbi:MAG: FAD-dependent oxidoreductase [Mongoliitalea sp.]